MNEWMVWYGMVWWTTPPEPAWKSICALKCLPLKASCAFSRGPSAALLPSCLSKRDSSVRYGRPGLWPNLIGHSVGQRNGMYEPYSPTSKQLSHEGTNFRKNSLSGGQQKCTYTWCRSVGTNIYTFLSSSVSADRVTAIDSQPGRPHYQRQGKRTRVQITSLPTAGDKASCLGQLTASTVLSGVGVIMQVVRRP